MRCPLAVVAAVLMAALLVAEPEAQSDLDKVFERVSKAMGLLDGDAFVGEYSRSTRTVVSTLDGDVKRTETLVERVSRRSGEEERRSLVRATRDGKDVAAERRKERTEQDRKVGIEVRFPGADELATYETDGPWQEGELLVAAFSPPSPPTGEETAGTGRVAWRPETLEPVWLEYRPAKLPKRMRELSLRVEFARAGDVLYPRRTSIRGVAGFLFIKRVFESTSAVSNLRLDRLQAPLRPE